MEALKNVTGSGAIENGLLFEKFVVDMMDIGFEDGILTSTEVPGVLSCKGWDVLQVANTQMVSFNPIGGNPGHMSFWIT